MSERLAGLAILLVEDEAPLVRVLTLALAGEGATVHAAATLGEAYALLARERVDIAVLDLQLREERTDALAAALKARRLPFICSTGSTDRLPEVFADGLCLQVRKPFEVDELMRSLSVLHAAARRSRGRQDAPSEGLTVRRGEASRGAT